MIRRILGLLLIIAPFVGRGQTVSGQGATNQVNYQRGGNGADSAFAIPVFPDTAKANTFLAYRKEGRIIYTRTPQSFWYNNGFKWSQTSTGAGYIPYSDTLTRLIVTKTYADSLYNSIPAAQNFANADLTFTGNRTHTLGNNSLTLIQNVPGGVAAMLMDQNLLYTYSGTNRTTNFTLDSSGLRLDAMGTSGSGLESHIYADKDSVGIQSNTSDYTGRKATIGAKGNRITLSTLQGTGEKSNVVIDSAHLTSDVVSGYTTDQSANYTYLSWVTKGDLDDLPVIDTSSLSNRINQKLNITDTTNKWIGKWAQPFYDTAYNLNITNVEYDSANGDAFLLFRNSSFYNPSELYTGTPMTFKYINNVIDLTTIIYRAKISAITGSITFSPSYNDSSKVVRLSVEPNTQYRIYFYPSGNTFYKKARFENASQQLISFTTTSPNYAVDTFTFTTPPDCVFVVINLNEQSGFGASVGTWPDNTDILTMVKTSEGLIQGVYTINSKTLAASTGYNLKIKTQITEDEDAVSKGWANDWDSRVEWVQFLYPKDSFPSFTHNLYRKGNTYTSDYDWTLVRDAITGDTVWVDPRVISSGSGSKASPLKSIHEATALVNSNNTYGAVAYVPFWYNYSEGPQGVVPNRSIKYILNGTGVATWSTHIPLTYSLFNSPTYTAVYSATYADTANNVAIIDLTKLDSFGLPIRYKRFASAINVNLNPGSYYYDRTNDVVYVKTFDGRAVDSNIRNLFSLSNVVLTNDEDSYLEYTKVWGGGDNAASIFNSNVSTPKTFVDMYCQFNYSTQQDLANTNINGIQASGNTVVYHYRSHSSYNETDGFDYFEDENIGMSAHGYEERTVGNFNGFQLNGSANNGSTGHRDAQVIRNGCVYVANEGRQVADIDNVRCYNVGILAGLSTAIDPFARYSYSMGRPTANSTATRSWFIECNSLDEKGFQLFDKSVTRINAGNFDVLKGNSIYPVATVFNLTKYRDIILK